MAAKLGVEASPDVGVMPSDSQQSTITGEEKGQSPIAEQVKQYTSFTKNQLRGLRLLLGFSAITSPLTATIYFPLLPLLRTQFHTSAQGINLTLTIYIIFQAISPVLFGPLSDTYGRRPMFLFTLAIYLISNIGLAANEHNYALLLVLRAFQSLGASAAYAIAFGVVADVCIQSERGRMLGPISMALNLGACVGPVVGGTVAYLNGSHVWVFWALVIVAAVLVGAVGFLLPETSRGLVGDGGDGRLFKWWQLSWLGLIRRGSNSTMNLVEEADHPRRSQGTSTQKSGTAAILDALKNLLNCFRIIFYKDTFLTVWMHGSFYAVDYSFVAALPDIFEQVYGYNKLYVGLAYLPRGVGIILGSYCTGRLMDHNYRATIAELGWPDSKTASGPDMAAFPIERARSRSTYWLLAVSTASMAGYGWAVSRAAHPAVPLALQFVGGFWGTYFYTTYSALMVDVFPESPSTAAAATSVARCAMAAAAVAILQPLLDAAGRAWYFTVLGLWSGMFGAGAVFMLRRKGMGWRRRRGAERIM
ncbi:hypothetical protein ACO1O0_006611 [Amphichorda felina]